MMRLQIERATPETRHAFAAIVADANAWQKARGSEGWNGPFDDDWLLPRIARGELYLALVDDEPVATSRILYEDHAYWGERETGDSIYLHTFAVARSRAGQGIGIAVVNEVARLGVERGAAKVRLDCFLANAGLIAFYERCGFVSVGTVTIDGRALNLMEKEIGSETTSRL